jgi:succinate-acetate transporter protein
MFLLSLINAGWLDQIGTFIPLAFFYGGLVQLLCGMWAFRTTNTFGAVVFTSYGAFWLAFGFFFFFAENLGVLTDVGASVGWTLVGWTVFTSYVWIACIKLNKAVFIMFSAFLLTLLLLDLGFLLAVQGLIVAGGYTGILLALSAWYISAASFVNHAFGRIVLPLGAPLGEDRWYRPLQLNRRRR